MYVYAHITPSNKIYIGITQDIKKRWRKNGRGYATSIFGRAIEKYGWNNIKHIILLDSVSKDVACECEKYLIAKYQTNHPKFGYNIAIGGEFNSGFTFHHTEDAKKKISEAGKGRIISEQQRKQISLVHTGKTVSLATRQKISETISGLMCNDYKQQISNTVKRRWQEGAYKNRKRSTKSVWNKGLTKDDPRVAKCCRKTGEFHHTEESKQKMSLSHRGKPAHNRRKVECVETGIVYNSIAEATKLTGIQNISVVSRNSNKTAGGFHWRCVND